MSYLIDDYSRTEIYVTDGWREWYWPKFRIDMEVAEPYLTINWDDAELGSPARRSLTLDYTDVSGYGYANPTSAADLKAIIEAYIISGWTDIPSGGDVLVNKGDLLTHDGASDTIQPIGVDFTVPVANSSLANGWNWYDPSILRPYIPNTEVITASLNATQNNYAISGASSSAAITTIFRVTPTVSFKFTGIDTTSWGNGKRLIIENVTDPLGSGARMMILERESASSSAANRFSYNSLNMPCIIAPGEKVVLEYNTTTSRLEIIRHLEPAAYFTVYSECYTIQPFVNNSGGAGAGVTASTFLVANTTYKNQGVQACNSGTTTTGRAYLSTGVASIMLGYGSNITLSRCGIDTLSTVTEEFTWLSGLCDNTTNVAPVDAVAWQYDRLTSTDFYTITASNSTNTQNVIAGFTPTVNQMVYLGTFVNGDGTNAEFFYSNDGETWTFTANAHTTNIPTGTSRVTGVQVGITKSAGTTARIVNVDSLGYKTIMKRGA